jgi:SAM-dependent methyltransferase
MTAPKLFDRRLIRTRRARASVRLDEFDFLHARAMGDIVDRLEATTRRFPRALFFGVGKLARLVTPAAKVDEIVLADCVEARKPEIVCEEEASPFAPQSFDLVVSLMTLHAVDDPVGALAQYARALKPDGLFIGAAFGEETLREMRRILTEAESETRGGAAARLHPNASVRDWGAALQRAGFAMPVADFDRVEVAYRDPRRLIRDLRGMGETGALADRPPILLRASAALFLARLPQTVTFDIVTMTGWAPAPTQQKPLKPGSAQMRLADALKAFGRD